jgi:MYXO-CTERM domain-containing protein
MTRQHLRDVLVGAMLLVASTSFAAPDPEVMEHPDLRGGKAGLAPHDINGSPYMMRQVGAGFEHANVAVCGENILIVGVGSYERDSIGVTPDMHAYGKPINQNDHLQTMAVAGKLTKDGLEIGGAYYVLPELSGGNRNRDGMKPQATCLDAENGLFVVDANYAPDNLARTYAAVFQVQRSDLKDLIATQLSRATMVLENANDNCSDRDYQDMLVRPAAVGYRVNLAGSCNGNGDDVAWVTYFDVGCAGAECVVTAGPKAQVSQGQIERYRAQTFRLSTGKYITIGTEGDAQPPMDGISATIYDGDTLQMLSSTTIADVVTTPTGTFYSTMSHVSELGPDMFLVTYQQRNGRNRREGKGATTLMMGVLRATALGTEWVIEPKAGLIQGFVATHHGSCTTRYGAPGAAQPGAFLISASPNGGTSATGNFVTFEDGALKVNGTTNLNTNIDSGLLSNYYGENPGNQGKNSLYCATIENPGFGIKGAYRPDVKEFVIVPATSRVPDGAGNLAEKLGLDVVLVPAVFTADDPTAGDDAASGCGCATRGDGKLPTLVLFVACALWLRRRRGN